MVGGQFTHQPGTNRGLGADRPVEAGARHEARKIALTELLVLALEVSQLAVDAQPVTEQADQLERVFVLVKITRASWPGRAAVLTAALAHPIGQLAVRRQAVAQPELGALEVQIGLGRIVVVLPARVEPGQSLPALPQTVAGLHRLARFNAPDQPTVGAGLAKAVDVLAPLHCQPATPLRAQTPVPSGQVVQRVEVQL